MANSGALPSRTSVTIATEDDGANAVIKAATPQQAGVMSADQARVLDQLRQLLLTGEASNVISMQAAVPVAVGNLSLPPPPEILPPNHADDLVRRVANLEKQSISTTDHASALNALKALRDEVALRLVALEGRVAKLETNDNAPAAEVRDLRFEIKQIQPFMSLVEGMINDPTPILVEGDEG